MLDQSEQSANVFRCIVLPEQRAVAVCPPAHALFRAATRLLRITVQERQDCEGVLCDLPLCAKLGLDRSERKTRCKRGR